MVFILSADTSQVSSLIPGSQVGRRNPNAAIKKANNSIEETKNGVGPEVKRTTKKAATKRQGQDINDEDQTNGTEVLPPDLNFVLDKLADINSSQTYFLCYLGYKTDQEIDTE